MICLLRSILILAFLAFYDVYFLSNLLCCVHGQWHLCAYSMSTGAGSGLVLSAWTWKLLHSVCPGNDIPILHVVTHNKLAAFDLPFRVHLDRCSHRCFVPFPTASRQSILASSPDTYHCVS